MKTSSILLAATLLLPGLARAAEIKVGARQADTTKALVKFVTAPFAAPVIRKHGLEELK